MVWLIKLILILFFLNKLREVVKGNILYLDVFNQDSIRRKVDRAG